jgi:hypothetical protein
MPCLRCRSTEPIAGPFSAEGRQRIAVAFKIHRAMEVILAIRHDAGCGLAEAKGTLLHLVQKAGECHWCHGAIPVAELVDCPRCEALNILLESDPSP